MLRAPCDLNETTSPSNITGFWVVHSSRLQQPVSSILMGKKKSEVQFDLAEAEEAEEGEIEVVEDEYLETPYTSILMSTASGDGCVLRCLLQHLHIPWPCCPVSARWLTRDRRMHPC